MCSFISFLSKRPRTWEGRSQPLTTGKRVSICCICSPHPRRGTQDCSFTYFPGSVSYCFYLGVLLTATYILIILMLYSTITFLIRPFVINSVWANVEVLSIYSFSSYIPGIPFHFFLSNLSVTCTWQTILMNVAYLAHESENSLFHESYSFTCVDCKRVTLTLECLFCCFC